MTRIYPNRVDYIPRKTKKKLDLHKKIETNGHNVVVKKKEIASSTNINEHLKNNPMRFGKPGSAKINKPEQKEVKKENIIRNDLPVPQKSGVPKVEVKRQPLHIKEGLSKQNIDQIINRVKREGVMKRAVKFGIVGLGQGGCRIAGEFEKLGYPTLAINTSEQDLQGSPCKNKFPISSGGAGKDLGVGASAINSNRSKIMTAYHTSFPNVEHVIVCAGSSGGTGGGGLLSIIDTLQDYKKPVGVITTFPLETEDTRSKKNTLQVLNELVKSTPPWC